MALKAWASGLVLALSWGTAALAQDGAAGVGGGREHGEAAIPGAGGTGDWQVRFEPAAWFVAPAGRMRLPGQPIEEEVWLSDLNLDSPRLSPFGELHVRAGDDASRWRLSASGFSVSAEDREAIADFTGFLGPHPIFPGDRLESSVTLTSGEAAVWYRLPVGLGNASDTFEGMLDVSGGVRFIHVDLDAAAPSGSIGLDEFFAQPIVGLKLNMEVTPGFTIDVASSAGFSVGGNSSSLTWDIVAGFMYHPVENVGVQVGYRQLLFDLESGPEDDRFEYYGAAAGIYGGVTIKF